MASFFIRLFGLRGSWSWACRQMRNGDIVYRTTDSGAAKYKLDPEGQERITWCFRRTGITPDCWISANIFLKDFKCTAWAIWTPDTEGHKYD